MLRTLFCVVITLLATSVSFVISAKIDTVNAEYLYQLPENISLEEGKNIALQRAQIQAIADKYGTVVTQTASTTISNTNGESSVDFLSIGGSEVKGEWLETIGEPRFEMFTDGGQMAIKVNVKGKIRENEGCKIPFDVKILRNGTSDADEADRFSSGDNFYLSFSSPVSGYFAVYLIDAEKQAYCLLPYQSIETGNFMTKANKKYLFFHPAHAEGIDSKLVDEYILDTSVKNEKNRILAIFSPNKFFKATDSQTSIDLPRSLDYASFQKWLSSLKKHDVDMAITEKAITIVSKD